MPFPSRTSAGMVKVEDDGKLIRQYPRPRFHTNKMVTATTTRSGRWMANDRCKVLGGQIMVIHDEPTWLFVRELGNNLSLWPGATDAETEDLWKWVDGKPVKFSAWHRGEPNSTGHALQIIGGAWNGSSGKREAPALAAGRVYLRMAAPVKAPQAASRNFIFWQGCSDPG